MNTGEQSQTVGLPLALGCTVKGLSVGLLSEQPPSAPNRQPMAASLIRVHKLLVITVYLPSTQ
jgi:hypothetical protein